LLQFKNGLENDHKVALTFYGNKHRVRVFRRAEDLKERVANFYDNMNEFYLNLDKELGEFDKLGQAVRRMMSIVSEAIGSPGSSIDQSSPFNREVSPDLDTNTGQYASTSDVVSHEDKKKPSSVRAIEDDFGNDNTRFQEGDSNDEDNQNEEVESSSDERSSNADGGSEFIHKTTPTSNPQYGKDSSPETFSESQDVPNPDIDPPLVFNLDPYVKWNKVFAFLRRNGWKWLNGNIEYDKILLKPGRKFKGGLVGEDFFPTDTCGHGDEIKGYMQDNYGWVGETQEAETSSSEESDAKMEGSDEDDAIEFGEDNGSEDERMVDDATNGGIEKAHDEEMDVPMIVETKRSSDVFEFKDEDECANENVNLSIAGYMPWMLAWQNMQAHGWTVRAGPGGELCYMRPEAATLKGDYGAGHVYEEDAKKIAKEDFGWKGEKPSRSSSQRNIVVSVEKPSKKRLKKVKSSSQKMDRKKHHNSLMKTMPKKSKWAAKKKRKNDDVGRTWGKAQKMTIPSPVTFTWSDLQVEGWAVKSAGKYNKLHDWYYIRPGFSPSKGNLGEHYFLNEREAVDYAKKQLEYTVRKNSSPSVTSESSVQIKSSLSPSPHQADNIFENNSSLDNVELSSKKIQITRQKKLGDIEEGSICSKPSETAYQSPKKEVTWKSLQLKEDWRVKKARGNVLHDWYYIRPGFSPSIDTSLGEHYFLNEFDAVKYAEEHHEECLTNHSSPSVASESSANPSPSIASEAPSPHSSPSVARESPVQVLSSQPDSPKEDIISDSSSEDLSFEPFSIEGHADSWWLHEKIPTFMKDVWKLLKKSGVKYGSKDYTWNGRVWGTVEEMRLHFCQEGLPTMAYDSLSSQELRLLSRFISLTHMPKRVSKYALDKTNSIEIFEHLLGGSSFNDTDAFDVLCENFGARIVDGTCFVDCISNSQSNFESIKDVRKAMRANGINRECGSDKDLDEAQVALLLWSSVLPLPIRKYADTGSSYDKSQSNTTETDLADAERSPPPKDRCQTTSTESEALAAKETKTIEGENYVYEIEIVIPETEQVDTLNYDSCGDTLQQEAPEAEQTDMSIDQTYDNEAAIPEGRDLDQSKDDIQGEVAQPGILELEKSDLKSGRHFVNPSESITLDASVAAEEEHKAESSKEFSDALDQPQEEESMEGGSIIPETQDDGSDNEDATMEYGNKRHYDYDDDKNAMPDDLLNGLDVFTQEASYNEYNFDMERGYTPGEDHKSAECAGPFKNGFHNDCFENINEIVFSPPEGQMNDVSDAINPPHDSTNSNLNVIKNLFGNS